MDVPRGVDATILVVDNNSTDQTAEVVADVSRVSPIGIEYVVETAQGKSFALNRGLRAAAGDVLALTDDDVVPPREWLSTIVRDFEEQEVTFVCGKVLPRWGVLPPAELLTPRAQAVWNPLGLLDYGDEPFRYEADRYEQKLPIGANVAFLRSALVAIEGWRTDLGKVNNTLISGEDHEVFTRLRQRRLYAGYYDPELIVRHYVPPSRLTRRYFRRWFFWHGKTLGLILDHLYPTIDLSTVPAIAGVPRFLYRQGLEQLWIWLKAVGRRDALAELIAEARLLQHVGLFVQCWRRNAGWSHV
jgi:glycosyltransferase involved in cell wall biosynthesis